MYKYNRLLDALLLAVITYHLVVSPYTKVEESFNIQAIHDILNYGVLSKSAILQNYDHIQFPGVVPRTFVGSLLIAGAVKLVNFFTSIVGVDLLRDNCQARLSLVVRGVLGFANGLALIRLRNSINRISFKDKTQKTKGLIGFWFSVLLLTQFHLLYYASRTLPNFIALPFVLLSFSKLIEGDISGITWLAFAGIIFRLEIGVLAVIIAIVSSLGFGQSNIFINGVMLAAGTILGALLTLSVDSYFWNETIIPELVSFKFNIINGKAAEWGVEPWSAYFNQYLPKIFAPPVVLLLALPGTLSDPAGDESVNNDPKSKAKQSDSTIRVNHPAKNSARILFTSAIAFISVMSFQPHKEWRFIVYTFPIFILQAANGLAGITRKWSFGFFNKVLILIILSSIALGSVTSILMGFASSFNYPGGDSLKFVNSYVQSSYKAEHPVTVHMDVGPCMTGINRFGELHNSSITYDKTENELDLIKIWNDIDITISDTNIESQSKRETSIYNHKNWKLLHVTRAFRSFTVAPIRDLAVGKNGSQFALKVFRELLVGKLNTLTYFLNSLILTDDNLFVYLRTGKDKNLDQLENAILEARPQLDKIKLAREEALLAVKESSLPEVDPDSLKEAVNSQIDDIESNL